MELDLPRPEAGFRGNDLLRVGQLKNVDGGRHVLLLGDKRGNGVG